ncbi:MAG: RNA polymerase sigma factor [Bacteroidetes bacterium]|nr:MAG: RNA polymerase sigma factor [Bacteroidota bacterium]
MGLRPLIEACIRKDSRAQRELYHRLAPQMLGVCYRYARDKSEAEDMLQEGFVKMYQNLGKYQHTGSFEGWVRRIMVNTAIDCLRRRRHQSQEVEIEEVQHENLAVDFIDELELEYLYQLIQELPDGYRLVFNLYAIEGYSHEEIGRKLGITASTSRSQYARARALLKKRICEDRMETNIFRDVI